VIREETQGREAPKNSVAVLADPVFAIDDPRVGSNARRIDAGSAGFQAAADADRTDVTYVARALRSAGALGDTGVPRLSRLPFSREEARAIGALAPAAQRLEATGFDASRATATSGVLGAYRFVHFATHGLLNGEHPELSGLVLSLVDRQGNTQDGFLRLNDIYNLRLPAEVVVLSACQTALGREIRGEGLVGLTRGFMYAGARRVVASLWQVDDLATAELMRLFYRGMLKDGLRPAAALRAAQRELARQPQWGSPYFWSAFVIQGEWR
jgi:CHAT domain-containing protein